VNETRRRFFQYVGLTTNSARR